MIFSKQSQNKKNFYFTWLFIGALIGAQVLMNYGFYINQSASFKEHFFIIKKHFSNSDITRDAIITKRMTQGSPYVPTGKLIVKKVVCESGNLLETRGKDFYCNGSYLVTALEKDSKGDSLEQFHFNGEIPKDKLFIVGENLKSYDSRYFGLIDKLEVEGVAIWRF